MPSPGPRTSSPHAAHCQHVWRAACRARGAPPARRARVQQGVRRAQLVAAAHVGRSHLPHRQRRPLRLARAHPGGGAVCKRRRSRPATAARTAPRRRHTAPSAAARARPAPRRTRGIGARPAMPCFVLYSSRERHASRCDCDEKLDTLCIGRCGRHLGSSAAWHSTHACRSDRSAQQAAHSSVCRGSCASCTCVTVRTSVLPAAPPRGRAARTSVLPAAPPRGEEQPGKRTVAQVLGRACGGARWREVSRGGDVRTGRGVVICPPDE